MRVPSHGDRQADSRVDEQDGQEQHPVDATPARRRTPPAGSRRAGRWARASGSRAARSCPLVNRLTSWPAPSPAHLSQVQAADRRVHRVLQVAAARGWPSPGTGRRRRRGGPPARCRGQPISNMGASTATSRGLPAETLGRRAGSSRSPAPRRGLANTHCVARTSAPSASARPIIARIARPEAPPVRPRELGPQAQGQAARRCPLVLRHRPPRLVRVAPRRARA